MWVFDGRRCHAGDLAGCATDTPGAVTPFPQPGFEVIISVAVDARLHSVYVTYHKDDALLVIDADRCNGRHLAACATLGPREIHTGTNPEAVALDPTTQTLYTADEVDNTVSVIDATRCSGQVARGCRPRVPEVAIPGVPTADGGAAATPAADSANGTVYVPGPAGVTMIDSRRCNAWRSAGCAAAPPTVLAGTRPTAVAVDGPSHTLYVADAGGTIAVLDDRTCNATRQSGCASPATLGEPGSDPGRDRDQRVHPHALHRDGHPRRRSQLRLRVRRRHLQRQPPRRLRPDARARRAGRRQLGSRRRRQPIDQHHLRHQRRAGRAVRRQDGLRHRRRHLRRHRHQRLRRRPRDRHAPVDRPRRRQPGRDRRRRGHQHDLHREPRRRRVPRLRLRDRRRHLQRPRHQRLRPDASHRRRPASEPATSPPTRRPTTSTRPTTRTRASPRSTATPAAGPGPPAAVTRSRDRSSATTRARSASPRPFAPPTSQTCRACRVLRLRP